MMRGVCGLATWTIAFPSEFCQTRDLSQSISNNCLNYSNYRFQLLKILQQFGEIEKFDMLFHRSGPLFGQPRGYAFVTYKKVRCELCVSEVLTYYFTPCPPSSLNRQTRQ